MSHCLYRDYMKKKLEHKMPSKYTILGLHPSFPTWYHGDQKDLKTIIELMLNSHAKNIQDMKKAMQRKD